MQKSYKAPKIAPKAALVDCFYEHSKFTILQGLGPDQVGVKVSLTSIFAVKAFYRIGQC